MAANEMSHRQLTCLFVTLKHHLQISWLSRSLNEDEKKKKQQLCVCVGGGVLISKAVH